MYLPSEWIPFSVQPLANVKLCRFICRTILCLAIIQDVSYPFVPRILCNSGSLRIMRVPPHHSSFTTTNNDNDAARAVASSNYEARRRRGFAAFACTDVPTIWPQRRQTFALDGLRRRRWARHTHLRLFIRNDFHTLLQSIWTRMNGKRLYRKAHR